MVNETDLVRIPKDTKLMIATHKATGQSYGGFITQVVNFWLDIKINGGKVEVKIDRFHASGNSSL
jgi:hypothetical protein